MASESPLTKAGVIDAEALERRTVDLFGTSREHLLSVAHRFAGEWRKWREVAEESDLEDPFAVGAGVGIVTAVPPLVPVPIEPPVLDIVTIEGDNLTEELGIGIVFVATTFAPGSTLTLVVADIDLDSFTLTLDPDGIPTPIEAVDITETLFNVHLETTGGDSLDIQLDANSWLLLWLMRSVDVSLSADVVPVPETNIKTLIVPLRQLRIARGE
jgi:hypothetical protein